MGMLALGFSGLNSSSLGLKFVVVGYSPSEGDVEEKDQFWNDMDRIRDREYILGDQNRWIGDRMRTRINGAFIVPGENDNGRRVVEF